MQLQFSFFVFFVYAVTVSIFPNYLIMQLQFFFAGINSAKIFCGRVCSDSSWLERLPRRSSQSSFDGAEHE